VLVVTTVGVGVAVPDMTDDAGVDVIEDCEVTEVTDEPIVGVEELAVVGDVLMGRVVALDKGSTEVVDAVEVLVSLEGSGLARRCEVLNRGLEEVVAEVVVFGAKSMVDELEVVLADAEILRFEDADGDDVEAVLVTVETLEPGVVLL
jgi:hypothetical protein